MEELQTNDFLKGGSIQIQKRSCWWMKFLEQHRMDARMHRNTLRMQDIPMNKHDKKPITKISENPTLCILQICGKLFLEKQELMLKVKEQTDTHHSRLWRRSYIKSSRKLEAKIEKFHQLGSLS